MELMAINEKQTIKNVKKKLREYPRWREVARDSAEQRITANYTFEPRSKSHNRSNIVETLAVRRVDAMNELEAIEEAHRNIIDERYRVIIAASYNPHQHQTGLSLKNWAMQGQNFKSWLTKLVYLLLKIIETVNCLICLNSWVAHI